MEDNFYKKFDNEKRGHSRLHLLSSFIFGILGALITVWVCFHVPQVNEIFVGSSVINTNPSPNITTTDNTDKAQISLEDFSNTSIYAANKVLPSIVGIEVEYSVNSFWGMTQKATAQGSGIIISEDGYILTNNHILSTSDSSSYYEVSEANSIKVSLNGEENQYNATIVGTDAQTDLAVIKIDKTGLTAAEIGNSDSLSIGEFVLAVGNPLGLQSSVTSGIVSALKRTITSEDGITYVVIQTDCAINAGNSGGALVNSKGQVIGINTLKLSGTGVEGVGFAIPINDTIEVYNELIDHGKVLRPYIGITGADLSKKQADYYKLPEGIYIQSIEIASAAEAAGLKVGDVITAIDGQDVTTMEELNKIKNDKKIGDKITLTITRDGKSQDVTLTLKEAP